MELLQGPCDRPYARSMRRTLRRVQLCVYASKPLMADFAQAPCDGPYASPMWWTFCKAHATDLTQGPCDGLFVGPIR
eukprot:1571097-Pleurochrysis_carterae.AAC.1